MWKYVSGLSLARAWIAFMRPLGTVTVQTLTSYGLAGLRICSVNIQCSCVVPVKKLQKSKLSLLRGC